MFNVHFLSKNFRILSEHLSNFQKSIFDVKFPKIDFRHQIRRRKFFKITDSMSLYILHVFCVISYITGTLYANKSPFVLHLFSCVCVVLIIQLHTVRKSEIVSKNSIFRKNDKIVNLKFGAKNE